MPSQYSMASTVVALRVAPLVAMQHRPRRLGMHALGERSSPGQVSGVLGTVGVMHLEADDLAAVEVEDQVEVKPAPWICVSRNVTSQHQTSPGRLAICVVGGRDARGG